MPKTMINGVGISYDVSGSGDPLVMIMGLGGNRSTWRFQVPVFEKYYRVITFDNRGVGDSDKPKGPYSIRQMADDALGLMDHLGIARSHILGASLGGTIAQELAINYPDRVSKLILACTYPCHDGTNGRTPEWADAIDAFIRYRKTPSITLVANSWPYRILGFFMMRSQYGRMDEAARAGFIAQNEAATKHNTLDRLSMIKASTLVITGTRDKAVLPASSDTIARLIPNARKIEIRGGGHGFAVENRTRFNKEVLAFLKNG